MDNQDLRKTLIKLQLCNARDGNLLSIGVFTQIKTLAEQKEYNKFPAGVTIYELGILSDDEIEAIASEIGISASKFRHNSDFTLNGINIKIIDEKSSFPIIKNLNRSVIYGICKDLNINLSKIDEIMERYWILRKNGSVGEEIANSNSNSPFKTELGAFSSLLEYFLFDGDEKGEYKVKADKILLYSKPLNPDTWKLFERKEVIKYLWQKLTFALKHHGLPSKYPFNEDNRENHLIEIWADEIYERYFGALNVKLN